MASEVPGAPARRGALRLERAGTTTLKGELVRGTSHVDTTAYAGTLALILVLLVKPAGLLGKDRVEKV